jgi:S1-C subfamily serine protease
MNLVDIGFLVIALLAGFRGWRRGVLAQVFELGGGFIGLLIGIYAGPRIADAFTKKPGMDAAIISLVAVFVILSIGQTVGYIIGHRFNTLASRAKLGSLNQGLGAAFGVLVWVVSFWLIGSLLIQSPSRDLNRALQRSYFLRTTNEALPQPPDVLAYLSQYLNTSGFPQVFVGMPRSVSPPVKLPTQAEARRAFEAGKDSTVRIVVPACGGLQLGSGWIAAEGTVVTNAHVVAGGDEVEIQQLDGSEVPGTVVLFDPDTDVAVIRASGLTGPVLKLEATIQDRGTPGATLGYPGEADGEFVPKRAAVQASYTATGRDIYGRGRVDREVYELRSPVRQGDSGGPFVLPDGRVAGVVFAASTTDGRTGYALTGNEVQDEVREGSGRTGAVDTGPCTR